MMKMKRTSGRAAWALGLFSAAALSIVTLAPAAAQGGHAPAAQRTASSGSGEYYIEFRSRYAWDYGHTYLIHARVGERITKANVAGLSPVGDDATAWVIGHFIPVPSETGASDGDIEDKYVSARYRVYMNKAQYDRVMAYVRRLQKSSPVWSAELYNCNAFVSDIAKYMGLRVPKSTLIYPKVFVRNLRDINTGHAEMADALITQNLKEMANPARDGRAMIMNGVRTVRDRRPASSGAPTVTIGRVRVSNASSPTP
jgi:hypothetical protein